jgi:Cys-rich repeat protein
MTNIPKRIARRSPSGRATVSWCLLVIAAFIPRIAHAATCTVPSDCFSAGQICHLGVCTPCESNFDDGGLGDPLLGCQDPSHPVCDIPDGSVGGQCVQCVRNTDCASGEVCDQATQTCVSGDAGVPGDAGSPDGSAPDAAVGDGSAGDGSALDGGDGSAPGDAASDGAPMDAAPGNDASNGDGSVGDASVADSGETGDATMPDGSSPAGDGGPDSGLPLDGAYVVGDGCACRAARADGHDAAGTLALAALVVLARRRRSR